MTNGQFGLDEMNRHPDRPHKNSAPLEWGEMREQCLFQPRVRYGTRKIFTLESICQRYPVLYRQLAVSRNVASDAKE